MNRWILVGSLGAVFLVTLGFSYGPVYGGRLSAFLGAKTSISPEVSPSNMVTPVVTQKQVVTLKNVTNVTFVSPLMSPTMSPLIYNNNQYVSMSPLVSPSPPTISSVSPSPTTTLQPVIQSSQPSISPSSTSTETPVPTLLPTPTPTPTPTFSPQSSKININTANKTDLMILKGIKDVKSDAVIQYRESHGPFDKIEDIMNVSGIGPATFDGIKDQITVGP